jgi:hypothetical protein
MPNWRQVLDEIQAETTSKAEESKAKADESKAAVDTIRRKYLAALHQHTGRNVIAYYSGFLSKSAGESEINDEDKNGFMMAIHNLDRSKGLDLILHTQGGSIAATESIVDYLHTMFRQGPDSVPDIRAIVPQIAMSAGTMIACSCRKILMSKHSNLGPIDPHLGSAPAYGVLQEFRRACREVKNDPSKIPMWQVIIGKYPPTFLSRCENAIKWSNQFVAEQLEQVMFAGDARARSKAKAIVRKLTDFRGNRTHERHIDREECRNAIGLEIDDIEADKDLQDLILTVHHCFMHSLMNTSAFKIIENHIGATFAKHQRTVYVQQ